MILWVIGFLVISKWTALHKGLMHISPSRRVTFLLLAQKKVTKEKSTSYRLFPVLLNFMGVNRKLASLKQPPVENSHEAELRRRGSRILRSKALDSTPGCLMRKSLNFRHSEHSEESRF
jgi:hypothetical protein